MAKQKKKKKKSQSTEHSKTMLVAKKKFPLKRALLILLSTLVAFVLYESVITVEQNARLGYSIIMPVYFGIIAVLLCAIIVLNRGFSNKPFTVEMLCTNGVAAEDAEEICNKLNAQKKLAKKLMFFLLPILLSVLLDIIYLFYGDFFVGAFKYLLGNS